MNKYCPECGNQTKHYPKHVDSQGNPTDGSYLSYCPMCDWDEKQETE